VPFVDCDGVAEGAYGKDRYPVDYNRSWWTMGRRHEVHAIMRDIDRWRARCTPRLCLDLHAPGALERGGCYVYTTTGSLQPAPATSIAWAERIGQALGPFAAADFVRTATYPSRWPRDTHPTFTFWAFDKQGLDAISLETPYQGFGLDDYRAIGRRIADALTG